MVDTITQSDQDSQAGVTALSRRGRSWLLMIASSNVALVMASMVALNAALPDIAVETQATQAQLTWVMDGYTLALACLLLPAGAIGDRYGRRGALLVGLAIFGIASAAPILFDTPTQLIVARAVTGIGAALMMPATLSLLTASFPSSERSKAVGIWAGVVGSAGILGFLVAGILLHFFSWQSIFATFAAASAAMFVLTCTIGSSADTTATPIDWFGGVLIGVGIAVFVLGVVEAPARGWSDPLVLGCLAGGVLLSALFTLVQLRRQHPLLDVRLFRRPDFMTGATGLVFLFIAEFAFLFVAMQFMQLVWGYTPLQTAVALSPIALPILVLGATVHLYLPKVGLRFAVSSGLLLIAIGMFGMRFVGVHSSFPDLVWPLLIAASGIGLCTAPLTSAVMNAAPAEKQGVASAVNDTTREVGAALGIAVAGSILAAGYHNSLAPQLAAFPEHIRAAATDSLATALLLAERMGAPGQPLADAALESFVQGSNQVMLALAVLLVIGAAFVALWSPGRDGQQLRTIERLRQRSAAPAGRHRA